MKALFATMFALALMAAPAFAQEAPCALDSDSLCCDGDEGNPDPLDGWLGCAGDPATQSGDCCASDEGNGCNDDPNDDGDPTCLSDLME